MAETVWVRMGVKVEVVTASHMRRLMAHWCTNNGGGS